MSKDNEDTGVPLGCSLIHGEKDPAKIRQHLKDGVNPNNTCLSGMTPLHWSRNSEITEILINAGSDVSVRDSNLTTPLHLAPDAKSVRLLIEHGAKPNSRDAEGNTPLHRVKNIEIAQELIKAGADINARNADRMTPLIWHSDSVTRFADVKKEQIVEFLIKAGADTSLVDRDGNGFLFREQQFAQKSKVHEIASEFFSVSIGLGIVFFIIVLNFFKKIKHSKYQPGSLLKIVAFLSLFINPFYFHLATISFECCVYGFLYWVPGSKIILKFLYFLFIFLVYHCCMFSINRRKSFNLQLKQAWIKYTLKNLAYWGLLPYYVLLVAAFTAKSSADGFGAYVGFFGIPYLIITTTCSYVKCKRYLET